MVNQKDILFGIIFLLLMTASIGFFEWIFVPSVSAEYDWTTYGNIPYSLNEQFSGSFGKFNYDIVNSTMSKGYVYVGNLSVQPLSTSFNFSGVTSEYLIFPINNYMEIYNKNLALQQEFSTGGVSISQIDIMDFSGDGTANDIVGIFAVNSTSFVFKVFSLNSSLDFNNTYMQYFNFNSGGGNIIGIKHSGNNAYFLYSTSNSGGFYHFNFTIINKTSTMTSVLEQNDSNLFVESPMRKDINNDGINEYITYSSNQVLSFFENGSTFMNYSYSTVSGNEHIIGARVFKADNTNIWKIAVLQQNYPIQAITVKTLRPDGTTYWSSVLPTNKSTDNYVSSDLAVSDDYNGDGIMDLYVVTVENYHPVSSTTDFVRLFVLNGLDGSILASKYLNDIGWTLDEKNTAGSNANSLTISTLNSDNYREFIYTNTKGAILIYDIKNNVSYENVVNGDGFFSCIPTDLNLDAYQEVVCSGSNRTTVFGSTYLNQNPIINSVIYNPSTTIQSGTILTATVNAIDNDSDLIEYSYSCFAGDNFTADTFSSSSTCTYNSVGVYNLTVRVHDFYHSTYNIFSQDITVLVSSPTCNNNGICESGETYSSCPNDCSSINQSQNQQATDTGGIPIPTVLVDTNNINQGLLPEIYFGTLGFLSNTLQPMIILIFMIFFVLIILAIAFIFRKIAHKVGDLR